jgi:hypothetical protein|tara:strand:- start:158 stop:1030 length:873 start_codon:yes stop_codon:yes gene_type:complete
MATVFYDKAAVSVEWGTVGETLLASDFTLNYSTSAQPLYTIGRHGSLGQFPSSARVGDISFNFITSLTGAHYGQNGNIINFLASGIKHSVGATASGVTISGAGVKGIGFLNSYSLNVASNSVSTSSASFTFFGSGDQLPVSGRLAESLATPAIDAGKLATGVAHGRYTTLTPLQTSISNAGGGATDNGNIFGADYSVSFSHNPVYKMGQEFPVTSFYTTAQESVNVTEDIFNSGLAFDDPATDKLITLKGLNSTAGSMELKMISGKQVSTSMSAGLDDIVRSQKTLTASY